MYNAIISVTGLVILLAVLITYGRFKDAFHPAIVLAPVTGYMYSMWPLILNRSGGIESLYESAKLEYVALLYLAATAAFYLGLTAKPAGSAALRMGMRAHGSLFAVEMTESTRRRLYNLALLMGAIAIGAYLHMIDNAGGFVSAYSRYKGGGWASSGYIGEAILLSFPGILLLALCRQGKGRLRKMDVMLGLLIAMPHLIQGTFGGRRGPLFLVLAVLFMAWFLARGRRPSLQKMIVGFVVIGLAVIVLQSQRRHLYLGSGGQFDVGRVVETVGQFSRLETNDYVTGVSTVLTVDHFDDYYWGRRYFVILFIRPIPKQIWPTKYEDVGADWLTRYDPNEGGSEFLEAVGFLPTLGAAPGFVADLYHEFAWGVVVVLFLFGRGLVALWHRHRTYSGLWTVLYAEAIVLGIYLPTQSFSAWFHRFVFMAVLSTVLWRFWIGQPVPSIGRGHRRNDRIPIPK